MIAHDNVPQFFIIIVHYATHIISRYKYVLLVTHPRRVYFYFHQIVLQNSIFTRFENILLNLLFNRPLSVSSILILSMSYLCNATLKITFCDVLYLILKMSLVYEKKISILDCPLECFWCFAYRFLMTDL